MAPLAEGIAVTKGLKTVQIDLSRAKIESDAFEVLSDSLSRHNLEILTFDVESMKISP